MTVVRTRGTGFARAFRALVWGFTAFTAGCGSHTLAPPGTPVITLEDTSGDFASYLVTLDSITLTAKDGTVVSLFAPVALGGGGEPVDLARLTDLVELLGAPAVPSGTYTSAQITLDYSAAAIYVNVNGHAEACTALNATGTTLTALAITVTFDPAHPLVITQGKSNRVDLDVDLAASNSVNTAASLCTVTVQPFLTMRVAPTDTPVMRARGLLVITQTGSSNFIMNTRPLFDVFSGGFGALTVETNAQTYFNVNGVAYSGAAGLAAMAGLTENTALAAYGTLGDLSGITPTFNASAVYVGTSLESPLEDHFSGVVGARSGDTLTLLGALLIGRAGSNLFADSATVTIGSGTVVSEDGVAVSGLTAASVSVGQQVDISGQGADNSGVLSMDATAGQVRLQSTRLWGTLNSASPGSASLNMQTLGNFASTGFNFAGTGAGGQSATPAAYLVNTGALNESATPAGTLLQVDGFVAPFGSAPPDFTATAITPASATRQELVVEWTGGGTATPFTSAGSAGFVVNLNNANLGTVHYIRTGPPQNDLDLKKLPASPLITTVGADQNDLQLSVGSSALTTGISVFNSASAFSSAVTSALSTHMAYRLVAVGQYSGNTFIASSISLALHE
jgi:hypothetical protein